MKIYILFFEWGRPQDRGLYLGAGLHSVYFEKKMAEDALSELKRSSDKHGDQYLPRSVIVERDVIK